MRRSMLAGTDPGTCLGCRQCGMGDSADVRTEIRHSRLGSLDKAYPELHDSGKTVDLPVMTGPTPPPYPANVCASTNMQSICSCPPPNDPSAVTCCYDATQCWCQYSSFC
jgi:hypothetical protein